MKNLFIGLIHITIGYALVWIQLFGYLKWNWLKDNNWWFMYVISLPIAYLLTKGTHITLDELHQSTWAVRFVSYVINSTIFAFMAYAVNNEGLNVKTTICLGLSLLILGIQFFWK